MPFPDPILPIFLIGCLASGFSFAVFKVVGWASTQARKSHTEFVFAQISRNLESIDSSTFPRTIPEFSKQWQSAPIDWNSCRLSEAQLLDAWSRAINVSVDPTSGVWAFRSAGKDGKFGSSDDLEGFATNLHNSRPTREP